MPLKKGPLLTLALCIGLPLLLAGGLMLYVSSAGVLAIDVRERGPHGDDISLRIPVWMIEPALNLVPGRIRLGGRSESDRWLPLAEAALGELERCPDAVLVRVDGPREKVRIEKKRDQLIINVDDDGDEVRVAIPATLARKLARFAARVCDRSTCRDGSGSDSDRDRDGVPAEL